jgi:hypothetical protein
MSATRSGQEWLIVNVYEGDRLIHDDGREAAAVDAEAILADVFGVFVADNCLQPPDLGSVRAELCHAGAVVAILDGRDW